MSTDHVVVFLESGIGQPRPLVGWPSIQAGDTDLAAAAGYAEALEHNATSLLDHHCFVPIGYAESGGQLLLVIHHRPSPGETDPHITETVDQVAATFLKMTSRFAYVSGLKRETRTDALTSLANRRGLFERLDGDMARAVRHQQPLSIAMLDLDRFKQHNDDYGHVSGDELLQSFAELLTAAVRAQDLVSRYGGDEFCIVLPETDLTGAAVLTDRTRRVVGSSDRTHGVMFSVGVAQWDGSEDATALIERADRALYQAKQQGRDRVISAPGALPPHARIG